MSTLSAAELQKRHALEGAPDPFPSLNENDIQGKAQGPSKGRTQTVDTSSEHAFPSLAPAPSATAAKANGTGAWGSSPGPRIPQKAVVRQQTYRDEISLLATDISAASRDGKPVRVGEVIKSIMTRFKVKVEASSQSSKNSAAQTTFQFFGDSQGSIEQAKRQLVVMLSPHVSEIVKAPQSTIPTIIGPKGSSLNRIREATNVKIDIPRRDVLQELVESRDAQSPAGGADAEEDEPLVPITVSGPQPLVNEAKHMLNAIISSKTSRTTQVIRDIPLQVLQFIKTRKAEYDAAAASESGGDITLSLDNIHRLITLSGDRPAVGRAGEAIRADVAKIGSELAQTTLGIPRRQHRLLVGEAGDAIFKKSRCYVEVPGSDSTVDHVIVWGYQQDLPNGLGAVMEQANSQHVYEFPGPNQPSLSPNLLVFLRRKAYHRELQSAHPGVKVHFPAASSPITTIELAGDKSDVDAAVVQLSGVVANLQGGIREVKADWLVHRIIQGRYAKKIKQFQDSDNVQVLIPPEVLEQSTILLVYDPFSPASQSFSDKTSKLDAVASELASIVSAVADVSSETIMVDKKWHDAILGRDGTTLNAIIGEDKALSIKFGSEAGGDDNILIRGVRQDVQKAVQEIERIAREAENDVIVNSYSLEFDIPRDYVGRVVGAQGTGVNRLREQLGVKIDFSDDASEDKEVIKKKKSLPSQKTKIKIVGRKENAEEAKKRIIAQVERLADETSEKLQIPAQYHSSLIGEKGKYVIRLEEKYGVKITFPRDGGESGEGKTRESLKSDEVLVKGGKKGVSGAKNELLEAVEYEKESNHTEKFTVPHKAIPRILGKGGASIHEIKDNTGTQIDVDKAADNGSVAHITVRGTKKAVAAAKAYILAISDSVGEEYSSAITIDNKFHRTIIGPGGHGLKDLIVRCGGPSDTRAQAGLIKFPRQGEMSDEVRLRGEKTLILKIEAELRRMTSELRDRVVLGVAIPASQHRALIGRGGQHLNDLQSRTNVQVQFPGSRSYSSVATPENEEELKDVDPADLVKVSGPRAGCEKAIEELKSKVAINRPANGRATPVPTVQATVQVPLKYYHTITQQGNFFRNLRSMGVQVDQSVKPKEPALPPQPPSAPDPKAAAARIDDDTEAATPSDEPQWQVIDNYEEAEDGNSEWTLRGKDQTSLDRAQEAIAKAIAHAEKAKRIGFLTLANRNAFPRIVGSKGANVSRLRAETGAEITVSRENSTIVIVGDDAAIEAAREAIQAIAASY